MMSEAILSVETNVGGQVLYMVLELSKRTWSRLKTRG
jgi:hypothetical protein